jgi:hypothetical protein
MTSRATSPSPSTIKPAINPIKTRTSRWATLVASQWKCLGTAPCLIFVNVCHVLTPPASAHRYTSLERCTERWLFAINNCAEIDADGGTARARSSVMSGDAQAGAEDDGADEPSLF